MSIASRALPAAVVLVAAATFASGCGRSGEKAQEQAIDKATSGQVQVDTDGKTVTVSSPDGGPNATFGSGPKVPDAFPKDVPVYPGAKVVGSDVTTNASGKTGFLVTLQTIDTADQVATYYKTELARMTTTMDMTSGTGRMLSFKDKTSQSVVNVIINGDAHTRKTSVSLQVGSE